MKYFWDNWKRKTKLEKEGIKSIKIAKKIILENIPKEQIISIYIKGSFVRREMNRKSDVDTSTILKNSKWLRKLNFLQKKYRTKYEPNLEFTGYSLWELKNNKKSKVGKGDRAGPNRAVEHLEHYRLIYGKQLKKEDFHQGDHKKRLKAMISVFNTTFLKQYGKKEFGFSQIIRQVFWLIENEQKANGKNPPHSWKGLEKSIKDPKHIIHETLKLRLKPTKDKTVRTNYIKKLKKYLKDLK